MRVIVSGAGLRTAHVIEKLRLAMPEIEIVGYCDPQPTHLDRIGADIPAYPNMEAMLSDAGGELLFVGSPNVFHFDQIAAGLAAGMRIFAEKPVVISYEETFALAELLSQYEPGRVMVGLVLRYARHMVDLRTALDDGALGKITSLEANEHIAPYHGAFFMRDWRRKSQNSGGFMLEKCCHDLDLYNMITGSRPARVASFGGRRSFVPSNAPMRNSEADIFLRKKSVWDSADDAFHSDGDIIDCQTAILEYESGASMAFHTNTNVPDEHRRFCVIGQQGMAEGDFVRGYLRITRRDGSRYSEHDYTKGADGQGTNSMSAHYGADELMTRDIAAHLRGEIGVLPVSVYDALTAGIAALALDQARIEGKIIDLSDIWARFDAARVGAKQ
ncbi:MAG: Gfo/Idh/MocA family oxidoreductase [Rhodobacteraceae bacterium]|nr:Gfo/Idh/MocA family oxidoreductase [Paracoccaceae bacterium]